MYELFDDFQDHRVQKDFTITYVGTFHFKLQYYNWRILAYLLCLMQS